MPEVEKKLGSSPDGLSQAEAQKRLAQYGENSVAVDKPHPIRVFLGKFWGPIPWMLEVAIILELALHWSVEAGVIGTLLVFNAVLSLLQENRAEQAMALLRQRLTIQVRVRRDGNWQTFPASVLVPGDLLHLSMGDLVAADVRLSDGHVLIDQSAVTGESEPIIAALSSDADNAWAADVHRAMGPI